MKKLFGGFGSDDSGSMAQDQMNELSDKLSMLLSAHKKLLDAVKVVAGNNPSAAVKQAIAGAEEAIKLLAPTPAPEPVKSVSAPKPPSPTEDAFDLDIKEPPKKPAAAVPPLPPPVSKPVVKPEAPKPAPKVEKPAAPVIEDEAFIDIKPPSPPVVPKPTAPKSAPKAETSALDDEEFFEIKPDKADASKPQHLPVPPKTEVLRLAPKQPAKKSTSGSDDEFDLESMIGKK